MVKVRQRTMTSLRYRINLVAKAHTGSDSKDHNFYPKCCTQAIRDQPQGGGSMSAQVGVNCCLTRSKATIDGGLGKRTILQKSEERSDPVVTTAKIHCHPGI